MRAILTRKNVLGRRLNSPVHQPATRARSIWNWIKRAVGVRNAPPLQMLGPAEVDHAAIGRPGRSAHRAGLGGGIRPDNDENRRFKTPGGWAREARAMLGTDGKLGGAWEYFRGIQEASVESAYFEPPEGDTSREAEIAAAFWNENLGLKGFRGRGRMWKPLRPQLTTILAWELLGVSLHEELYTTLPWGPAGGRELIWLRSWEPRHAALIDSWIPSADGDRWIAVNMRDPNGFGAGSRGTYRLPIGCDPELPGKGTLHIAHDIEGGDPEGRLGSILRHCYNAWRIKQHGLGQLKLGLTRWGSPIPVLRIFHRLAEDLNITPAELADLQAIAAATLANLRSTGEAWAADSDVAEVREFGGDFQPSGIVETINLLNHEMLTAMFMHWLVMGIAATHGSRAASFTHANALHQVAANYMDRTAEEITSQTVSRINAWNFGDAWPVPVLVFPGIRPNAAAEFIPHLNQGLNLGAITPTDSLERFYLEQAGAPVDFPSRDWKARLGASSPLTWSPSTGIPPLPAPGPGRPEGSENE